MKYTDLKQHINDALTGKVKFAPIYCVFGDDDRLVCKALKMFESIVSTDYEDFNLVRIKSEQDVAYAMDALETFPVFDEYKVVILSVQNVLIKQKKGKNDGGNDFDDTDGENSVKKSVDAYAQSPSPTSVFVLDCASKEVASAFKYKNMQSVDCSRLDEAALLKEIEEIAATPPSCAIEPQAAKELMLRTQNGMGRIESEMAKLKAYSQGVITKRDVCDMVVADLDYKMYELANAVSQKNCDAALQVLNVFFENGLRGSTVLSLLYGKYRELLHVGLNKNMSNDDLAKLLGLARGGAVYYLKQTSANYSQVRLKKCVDYLHNLQYEVLSGQRNENSAVHEAILQLIAI